MGERKLEFDWSPLEFQVLQAKLLESIAVEYRRFIDHFPAQDIDDADDRVLTTQYDPTYELNGLLANWHSHLDVLYEPNRRKVRNSWHINPDRYQNAAVSLIDKIRNDPKNNSSIYRPKIFELANNEVMKWLKNTPHDIDRVHDRSFELIIAEVIKDKGWEVQLTKQTRDGGYDILGTQSNVLGFPMKVIVECKRYAPKNKVGIAMVDRLMGVTTRLAVDRAIFVTTSCFTKPVWKAWEDHINRDLELVDREELLEWLRTFSEPK
jgi:HJR/Mrr/RecB family endonuclease